MCIRDRYMGSITNQQQKQHEQPEQNKPMDQWQIVLGASAASIGASVFVISKQNQNYFWFQLVILAGSIGAFFITHALIPVMKKYTEKAGLWGKDINKKGTPAGDKPVPESLGIVPATVFLLLNFVGLIYSKNFGESQLFYHCAAILSICFIVFLGFGDDVLDLPWRYKLVIPPIASLPLLIAYSGSTTILVPLPLRSLLGDTITLGFLYYIYMGMLAVFCTNSINIYAGINGLEAGQSMIIACAILIHNIVEIHLSTSDDYSSKHMLSVMVITPYLLSTLALFKFNKYPSQVFVGDTFCYFSGMTFAVCGILGTFSKTLLLFFIPQILNFPCTLR
eukprot:TRINITY_DN3417_c0_g1_i8.p1 TRINITY_DN3417_c0_g1~~TRINITY_DN3417_c0_g1_i8.p1  ORF type:complete len:359 (+),score=103.27 TRINITY_DN3417_c0_g1_i8:72-1079(+)